VTTIGVLSTALFLAFLNKALLDAFADPIRRKFPSVDLWWMNYVAFVTGLVIVWLSGINILEPFMGTASEALIAGRVLTGLLVGGGTDLINDLFSGVQGRSLSPTDTVRSVNTAMVKRAPDKPPRGW
jgi:hypothetical protein